MLSVVLGLVIVNSIVNVTIICAPWEGLPSPDTELATWIILTHVASVENPSVAH